MQGKSNIFFYEAFEFVLEFFVKNVLDFELKIDLIFFRLGIRTRLFLVVVVVLLKFTEILSDVLLGRLELNTLLVYEVPHWLYHLLSEFIQI